MTQKEVPDRHIYFVLDGQDVMSETPFMFSHLEVNWLLEPFIDKSLWVSKAAQRLSFYELLEQARPPQALLEQVITELMDKVNSRLAAAHSYEPVLTHCFTLAGERVQSLMDLHIGCRVLLVSPQSEF